MYVLIHFCHASGQPKNVTGLKFGTHSTRPYLKTDCFSKKSPGGPLASKTAVSPRFSAYLLDYLVLNFFHPKKLRLGPEKSKKTTKFSDFFGENTNI